MTRQAAWLKKHPYYSKLWRLANREKVNKSQKAKYNPIKRHGRYHKAFERNKQIILQFKSLPCIDCRGSFDPFIMHFDHRNPKDKLRNVSKMGSYSEKLLLKEIEKCDVVCANCHGLRTLKGMREGKIAIFGGYHKW